MTLTTDAMQEIYESAVHSEASGDDQDAHFELLCKLEDVGGAGATIRKLIDMVRAANREAHPVAVIISRGHLAHVTDGDLELGTKLYTAPPAPAVPEEMKRDPDADVFDSGFMNGWNACRNEIIKSQKD